MLHSCAFLPISSIHFICIHMFATDLPLLLHSAVLTMPVTPSMSLNLLSRSPVHPKFCSHTSQYVVPVFLSASQGTRAMFSVPLTTAIYKLLCSAVLFGSCLISLLLLNILYESLSPWLHLFCSTSLVSSCPDALVVIRSILLQCPLSKEGMGEMHIEFVYRSPFVTIL